MVGDAALVVNLGLRTESEKVPSFRPDIQENAFEFGFGDKMAPRLGASFDVRGDGKMKLSGSWGRYYDWTKYALSRGSFGGDLWHIFYRSLDTLDIAQPEPEQHAGPRFVGQPDAASATCARRSSARSTRTPSRCIRTATNVGVEYQLNPTTVLTANYVHNNLGRTIEDFSALVNGDNVYTIGNPGEGRNTMYPASYAADGRLPDAQAQAAVRRTRVTLEPPVLEELVRQRQLHTEPVVRQLRGLANSDEILTPTTGVVLRHAQQQAAASLARAATRTPPGISDTILWDSHGQPRRPRPAAHGPAECREAVWLLHVPVRHADRRCSSTAAAARRSAPSSTSLDLEPLLVNGRGDMGRTPVLTRTDLLVSHELLIGGTKKMRFELNVLNIFNQKTATHLFNFLNKGAPGGSSTIPANAIDMSRRQPGQGLRLQCA